MSTAMETRAVQVEWFTEAEVQSEFARIMREWDFAPYRRGEVRLPSRAEVGQALASYDRPEHVHRLAQG